MPALATITQIYLYPVKSMRGVAVDEAHLTGNGFVGDRRYAFVRQEAAGVDGFPWMTGREKPPMILHTPQFGRIPTSDDTDVPIPVQIPDGPEYDITDPRLNAHITQLYGHPVFLFKTNRGNYDSAHVSLLSHRSIEQIQAESGATIDPRQFRANLYIEPTDGVPFRENEWVGRVLQLGDTAQIGVTKRDERCMMINLNPDTAIQDPAVLRTVVKQHEEGMGIYANAIVPGIVRVGDTIRLV